MILPGTQAACPQDPRTTAPSAFILFHIFLRFLLKGLIEAGIRVPIRTGWRSHHGTVPPSMVKAGGSGDFRLIGSMGRPWRSLPFNVRLAGR